MSVTYFLIMTAFSWIQYQCFWFDMDLAWYGNLLSWNADKPPLYSTINDSWLGNHFEPIAIILLPLFTLFPSAWTLVLFQNFIFCLLPWLTFFLFQLLLVQQKSPHDLTGQNKSAGEIFLKKDALAVLVSLWSILNPGIWYVNQYDFHWTVLTIPLTCWFFIGISKSNPLWCKTAIFLLLMCKEDAALLALPLTLVYAIELKRWREGTLMGLAIGVFFLIINALVLPALGSSPPLQHWNYLGADFREILLNLILHPKTWLEHLWIKDNFRWLLDLLLPWGLLSLLNWRILLALPVFLTFGISANSLQRTIQYQNSAMLLPVLQISALYTLAYLYNILCNSDGIAKFLLKGTLSLAFLLAIWNNFYFTTQREQPAHHVKMLQHGLGGLTSLQRVCPVNEFYQQLSQEIPQDPNLGLIVTRELAPHFIHFPKLHLFDRGEFYKANKYADFQIVLGHQQRGHYRSGPAFEAFVNDLRKASHWSEQKEFVHNYFILKQPTVKLN